MHHGLVRRFPAISCSSGVAQAEAGRVIVSHFLHWSSRNIPRPVLGELGRERFKMQLGRRYGCEDGAEAANRFMIPAPALVF